jgi:exodeoxyribonuclease VII small subunit
MAQTKTQTFEAALEKLEKTIEALESDDLTLEKALAYFEEGIGLIRTCESHLRKAEGTLRELVAGENGELIERVIGADLTSLLGGDPHDNHAE